MRDLLQYLPFASAVLVGLVAARIGRNGWKWATLTFFAVFLVFFLAITLLNKSATEMFSILPVVVLVLVGLLARFLPLRNIIINDIPKRGSLILGGTLAIVLIIALIAPQLTELQIIRSVRENYSIENAVYKEMINRGPNSLNKPTVEEVLNPQFLKKYNLSMNDYEDTNGYFAPNGRHWNKWATQTKIAAILLFSAEEQKLSIWEIRRIIHSVDDYYSNNDNSVAVVDVVRGTLKSASRGTTAAKPPAECATAKNAAECADTLKKLGKNPFDAFGSAGSQPEYRGQR
jgi:hypothetical protein